MNFEFEDLVEKKHIYFDEIDLRDNDIEVLTRVLEESKVLEVLVLCSNHINLADGTFASALKHNHTLRVLNLYNNKVGVEGAKGLAAALKENDTLQQLHLGWNHIGDRAAQMLADSLAVNRGLRKIWLNGNKIGDRGAHKLANALVSNHVHVPKQITLEGNHMSSDMKKTVKSICEFMAKRSREMRSKEREIAAKDKVIASKDESIARRDEELESKDEELVLKDEKLASKEEQISVLKLTHKRLEWSNASDDISIRSTNTPELIVDRMENANKRRRIRADPEVSP